MIGLIILTILIMVEDKCEYCNRKPYYKISSFHSGYLVLPGQKKIINQFLGMLKWK